MSQQAIFDELPNTIEGILLRMNQELTCPICLTLLDQCTSTPCGHVYCRACIVQSLGSLSKCPICKTNITKRSLSGSDSVEAIVQEFLILRHQYEMDSGQVLTQLPSRAYQQNPQNDLSQLYPYPSKPNAATITEQSNQQQQKSNAKVIPTAADELNTQLDQRQQSDSSDTGAGTTESNSMGQSQTNASSDIEQQSHIENTSETHDQLESEQVQQNEPSTLSLILFPPVSPLPQPAPTSSKARTKVNMSSPPSSTATPPLSSPPPPSTSSSSSQRPLSQQTLTQAFDILKRKPSRSPSLPNTTNITSERVKVYAVSQLENITVSYLEELQTLGKLELANEAHVSSKVTHFVFPAKDAQGIQNVTGAYLQALVLRKQIVHEQWIHKCYHAKTVLDATPFSTYYVGDGQAYYKNGPIRARQSASCKEPPLFHGKTVYFHESVIGKLKKQFTNLMIAGGGQVIQNKQGMTPDTIILCQALSKKKDDLLVATLQSHYGKLPISIVWMTQSILRYDLLNEEDFIIGF